MQVVLRSAGVKILQVPARHDVCPKDVSQRYQEKVQLWRFTYKRCYEIVVM